MKNTELLDKIAGCLVAGAAGDALGYPVEFIYSHDAIAHQYGPQGITAYDRHLRWSGQDYDEAQISDDTQMTLYTVEAFLEAHDRGCDACSFVTDAYLAWLNGQTGHNAKISYDSALAKIPEFNQRRAPGNTCLDALETIARGGTVYNNSKGCGGIMRVAPVGLLGALTGVPLSETARRGGEVAMITHKHPMSTYASAAMAVIVRLCAEHRGTMTAPQFDETVLRSLEIVAEVYGRESSLFCDLIRFALEKASDGRADHQVIEAELGEGWIAEETLAIAVFCVRRHIGSVADTIIAAANHGGDSDSTGAVAGNIIGAISGYGAIPAFLTETLQFHDLILQYARRLNDAFGSPDGTSSTCD